MLMYPYEDVFARAGHRATGLNAACEWAFRLPRRRPLERLELIHAAGNHASCRVADKAGFALTAVLPPLLPEFPNDGHLHIRLAGWRAVVVIPEARTRSLGRSPGAGPGRSGATG
jgi:hypothetical protein